MNAVERTEKAIATTWAGDAGRQNQGRAFIKRAKKNAKKRDVQKASRRRNRR